MSQQEEGFSVIRFFDGDYFSARCGKEDKGILCVQELIGELNIQILLRRAFVENDEGITISEHT